MSTQKPEFRPPLDEEPVQNPQLRILVDAARDQPIAPVRVTAEDLVAQWNGRRKRRRTVVMTAVVGLAAASVLLIASPWSNQRTDGVSAEADDSESIVRAEPTPEPEPTPDLPETKKNGPSMSPDEPRAPTPPSPRLAAAIEVESLDTTGATPQILGPHRMRLAEGRWSVDSQTAEVVEVEAGDHRLVIRGGHAHIEVAGDAVQATVLRGEVTHFDAQGQRLESEPTRRSVPTADALAREAETHLAAGRRGQAIKSLRRLVTLHPRSPVTPTALIDLGRLLERSGKGDHARCAYALFLKRWPGHALSSDVTRARESLGDGRDCRGLRPRR